MHWTRRVGLLCLGLVTLGLARVGQGQDNIAVNDSGVVYLDDFSGSVFLSNDGGNYLLFQKMVGKGVGHQDGYSRLGVRTRLWEDFDKHLFGEVHALITDTGRLGYNVGGGFRKQSGGGVLGVHAWYDDYETGQENRYRQITGGFEYLHPAFDIRSNAYIPIDERENYIGIVNRGTDLSFAGNNLVSAGVVALERAFYGWDLEGGGPVPLAQNWLRAYGGIYQLLYDGDATTGFRARAEARFMEGANLNLIVSEDDKFGTNVNLGVEIRFRGTMPSRFQSGYLADRRYDQVRRVWPVQTNVDNVSRGIPVSNPGTDDPIQFVFIDNTNSGGTGTFEDPLESLPSGDAAADIFLVNTGSGSTFGNITLLDGQQILGAGKPHMIDTAEFGVIQLPSEFNQISGNFPILESVSSTPIITLANDNVVSGFNLIGENGVVGSAANNFLIECLHSDDIKNGVVISNATGTGIVRDIDFAVMPGGIGVGVSNATSSSLLDLTIQDVLVDGGLIGVGVGANGGDVDYNIDGVTVVNTSLAGVFISGTDAAINGTIDGTVVDDNFGNGVLIDLSTASGTTDITGLQASGNGSMGMDLDGVKIVATDNSNYNVNIMDSTIDGAMDDGIDASLDMGSILNVFVDPTSIMNSADNSFEFTAADGATLNATFDDVNLTGALNDAINGLVMSASTANLSFTNFDASGSVNDGLDVAVQGGSILVATFDNTGIPTTFLPTTSGFSNSGNSAVTVDVSDGSDATLVFNSITADNLSAAGGVNLTASMESEITSTWTTGSISDGLANGVTLNADDAGSIIDATFTDVAIDGNLGDGINASLMNGDVASLLNVTLNNVTLTGNSGDGLDYEIDGTDSMGVILFNNADLSGNSEDAFQFDVTGGALLMATTTSSTNPLMILNDFSSSGGNAFQGTVDGTDSMAIISVSDTDADSSGEEGALLNSTNGGALGFTYTNGTLSDSGLDGLSTTTDSGSLTAITLDNVTLDGNGLATGATSGDGLVAVVNDNSMLSLTLNDISTNSNLEKGVSLTASNASMILSESNTGTFVSRLNQEEGLFFDVNSGSTLTFNSTLGTTSFNGIGGTFSGVNGSVDGANSMASVSFDNFSSDSNTLDGFTFDVTNGGMFVGELLSTPFVAPAVGQTSTASDNLAGAGIRITASDVMGVGTTAAAFVMDGANNVSGNLEGLIVDAMDAELLAIQATGTFDNNGDFTNMLGGYGIQISSVGVTQTAIELGDGTLASASGNYAGGIELNLDGTELLDIDVMTLTQTETVTSLNVDNFQVSENEGHGLNITAVNGTVINDASITNVDANLNNDSSSLTGEDGIRLFLDNSTINNFDIQNNGAQMNSGNGINVDLANNSVSTGLNINNNVGAPQNLGIEFLIDGNVLANPFAITNTSDPGLNISNVTWDLSAISSFGPVFNTTGAGSVPFSQVNNGFFTGLTQVNGVGVGQANMAIPDNSQLLSLDFNSFNPDETFEFNLGVDLFQSTQSGFGFSTQQSVFGNDLIGSAVTVDFANGAQVIGQLDAVTGNLDAATFNILSTNQVETGLLNNGEDGLRVHVDSGSTLTDSTISGNITSNNGSNGIEILVENGSFVDMLNILGTTANDNIEEGILFNIDDSTITNGAVIDGTMINDPSGPNGIVFNAANGSSADSVTISNSIVQNTPQEGILVTGMNSTLDNIIMDGNIVADDLNDGINSTTGGVRVDLMNTAVAGTLSFNNGSIENTAGNGLTLNLDGSPVGRLEISGNDAGTALAGGIVDVDFTNLIWTTFIDNNNSPGLDIASFVVDLRPAGRVWRSDQTPFNNRFEVTGGSGVTTGLNMVNGVTVNPATNPLQDPTNNNAVLAEGGVATGSQVVRFNFLDFNPGEQFAYSLAHSQFNQSFNGNITGAVGTVTLTDGRTASAVATDSFGFNISQSFAQTFGGISSNAGSGVVLNATNGSNIGEIFIDNNNIQDNGLNGIEFNVTDSTLPTVGNESVISNNIIGTPAGSMGPGSTGMGDAFAMTNVDTNGTDFQLDFVDNDFSENNGNGINIGLSANSGVMTSEMTGNTISDNVGFGVRLNATGTSGVNLTLGDSAANANAIQRNQNAGVAITLAGTTASTIQGANTTISNTTAGTDMNFAGEGLAIRLTDEATLSASTIGDATVNDILITENAGDGIQLVSALSSSVTDLTLQNFTATANRQDGVNILRQGSIMGTAQIDNLIIDQAIISGNLGDGIDIVGSLGDLTDTYTISNTTIDMNQGRGVSLEARIDADIEATLIGNTITNNNNDGVSLTQVTNTLIDTPTITLDLSGGEISSNNGFGIDVEATHALTVDGVTIDSNSLGGIDIAATRIGMTGVDSITNSTITGNGNFNTGTGNGISSLLGVDTTISGNTISGNADNGIALTNGTHTLNTNIIEMNGVTPNPAFQDGDGIQLISNENGNLVVTADGNMVRSNRGRGVNLLVQGNTNAEVTFNNGRVEGNMKEGVYLVNTTSLTQSVDALATTALQSNGDIFANPTLVFNFDKNNVLSNGLGSTFDGTGLVMRIGTSGASNAANAYEDSGDFVSNGAGILTGRGGVLASITDSSFTGNSGTDVMFESFNSTAAPAATAGTWNAANYEITAYEQDPLARLDLTFTGNSGEDADVVRMGASFTNPEDVFKSRTTGQVPGGPFSSGARARNAQRLASRTGFEAPLMNTPGTGVSVGAASTDFLYSGVGGSTFRYTAGSTTAANGIGTGFTSGDDFMNALQLGAGNPGELDFIFDEIP